MPLTEPLQIGVQAVFTPLFKAYSSARNFIGNSLKCIQHCGKTRSLVFVNFLHADFTHIYYVSSTPSLILWRFCLSFLGLLPHLAQTDVLHIHHIIHALLFCNHHQHPHANLHYCHLLCHLVLSLEDVPQMTEWDLQVSHYKCGWHLKCTKKGFNYWTGSKFQRQFRSSIFISGFLFHFKNSTNAEIPQISNEPFLTVKISLGLYSPFGSLQREQKYNLLFNAIMQVLPASPKVPIWKSLDWS